MDAKRSMIAEMSDSPLARDAAAAVREMRGHALRGLSYEEVRAGWMGGRRSGGGGAASASFGPVQTWAPSAARPPSSAAKGVPTTGHALRLERPRLAPSAGRVPTSGGSGMACREELDYLVLYVGQDDATAATCGNGRVTCPIGPPFGDPGFIEAGFNPSDQCRWECVSADESGVVLDPSGSAALLQVTVEDAAAEPVATALQPLLEDAWTLLRGNVTLVSYIFCLYETYYQTNLVDQTPSYLPYPGYSAGWASSVYDFLVSDTLRVHWATATVGCRAERDGGAGLSAYVDDVTGMDIYLCANHLQSKFWAARAGGVWGFAGACPPSGDQWLCLTIDMAAVLLHEIVHVLGWLGHDPNLPGCLANTLRWALSQRYGTRLGSCCDRFAYVANVGRLVEDTAYTELYRSSPCLFGTAPGDYTADVSAADQIEMRARAATASTCCPGGTGVEPDGAWTGRVPTGEATSP